MGGGASSPNVALDDILMSRWKQVIDIRETKERYVNEGILSASCSENELELRALLEDEVAFAHLRRYAEANDLKNILICWALLEEYGSSKLASSPFDQQKLAQLYKICNICFSSTESPKYLRHFEECRARIEYLGKAGGRIKPTEAPRMFFLLQLNCFECILHDIYEPFKNTSPMDFSSMCAAVRASYNQVTPQDFSYLNKLAVHDDGVLLHCVKKSTSKHYVMKVQLKSGLIDRFIKTNPADITAELRTNASLSHPYLTPLAYAFQTTVFAITVFPSAECGTLGRSLQLSPSGVMSTERVQFYVAEIISALMYLHQRCIVFKDLSVDTVMLKADGHVMLADVCGDAEYNGDRTPLRFAATDCEESNSLTASSMRQGSSNNLHTKCNISLMNFGLSSHNSNYKRESVDGSGIEVPVDGAEPLHLRRFPAPAPERVFVRRRAHLMPPEVMAHCASQWVPAHCSCSVSGSPKGGTNCCCRFSSDDGFSAAMDWWGLGLLAYRLLTGCAPFQYFGYNSTCLLLAAALKQHDGDLTAAYTEVFDNINFEMLQHTMRVAPSAADLICGLLEIEPRERLGMTTMTREDCDVTEGMSAHDQLCSHIFFRGLDWTLLEQQELLPPYLPFEDEILHTSNDRPNMLVPSLLSAKRGHSGVTVPATYGSTVVSGPLGSADQLETIFLKKDASPSTATIAYEFNEMLELCDKPDWKYDPAEPEFNKSVGALTLTSGRTASSGGNDSTFSTGYTQDRQSLTHCSTHSIGSINTNGSMRIDVIGKVSGAVGGVSSSRSAPGVSSNGRIPNPQTIAEDCSIVDVTPPPTECVSGGRYPPSGARSKFSSGQQSSVSISSINWSRSDSVNNAPGAEQDRSNTATGGATDECGERGSCFVAQTTAGPQMMSLKPAIPLVSTPSAERQLLFMDWNFVSPCVLLAEDASVMKKRRGGFITRVLGTTKGNVYVCRCTKPVT